MSSRQADLFAHDDAERNRLSDAQRSKLRSRLEATLARLEGTATFPWHDPLDAVHEENRFQHDADRLGDEGTRLWSRFDREMDRCTRRSFRWMSTLPDRRSERRSSGAARCREEA